MKLFRLGVVALALVAGHAVAEDTKPAKLTPATPTKPAKPAAEDAKPVAPTPIVPANPAAKFETTHKVVNSVEVRSKSATLQTLCADPKGRVVALVAPPKPFSGATKGATAELHVFDADGKPVTNWKVDFHVTAVNCGPDGTIFAAGAGKLARFDADGKQIGATADLPHVAEAAKNKDALRVKAEAQLKREKEQMVQVYANARKSIEDQLKKIEEKKAEDRTKTESRQIDQYKQMVKQYEQIENEYKSKTVEQVIEQMMGRMGVANGLAVSDKDVFVACGDVGYGYAVWRFTKDLKEPKQILGEIGGCCGQMDIQCCGSDVLVAENTKHQFAKYDREGKKLGAFGSRGNDADPKCFGGCCNPMNVRALTTGEVYTAESEGVIKRFGPAGEFIETVGVVNLTGGCKNVAVAASADGSRLYFCDQPGSKFHILERKSEKKDK